MNRRAFLYQAGGLFGRACGREGINPNLYYRWSKDFLEAGKKRLSGDTVREANTDEVTGLKRENGDLKQAVAELYLRNDWLKKSLTGQCPLPHY